MSYSKAEIRRQQVKAMNDFVVHAFDEHGEPILRSQDDMEQLFRRLIRRFGFDLIRCQDRQLKDDSSLKAITKAIQDLRRSGQRVSVAAIAKAIRMNHWSCRQLMVRYGMFDVDTKQVIDTFRDWQGTPDWSGRSNGSQRS